MQTDLNIASFLARARAWASVAVLSLLVLAAGSPAAIGQTVSIPNPIRTYASWGDEANFNAGMVFIYPLEDGTDLNLYESTLPSDTPGTIRITTPVLSRSGAAADVPIAYGPLTADHHFFKLESNKPVNWELVTPDYNNYREASRFVASERQTFLGTKFLFHADDDVPGFDSPGGSEEIVIINPGTTTSSVQIQKFVPAVGTTAATFVNVAATTIPAGGFREFTVAEVGLNKQGAQNLGTGRGHYRILVDSGFPPVLVWEGRWLAQNHAIGAASDGSTIGSTIYASVPNDESNAGTAVGVGVILRVIGVTGTGTFNVWSSPGPGSPFALVRSGTVAAGTDASLTDLEEDRLYRVEATGVGQKIQVQYGVGGGAEMIGGDDGGKTTNPGKTFQFFFEGAAQKAIDVLIPQGDTSVIIAGPTGTTGTTYLSVNTDEVLHFPALTPGLYSVTASNPVWVVLTGDLGDQQGYFVYTSGLAAPAGPTEVSSSLGPINLRYCHSAAHTGPADCKKTDPVTGEEESTTGKIASEDLPQTACATGQPTTGTASVRVTAGDAITFNWGNINCGAENGSQAFMVNQATTALLLGTVLEMKAEHVTNPSVRLRVVPRETEYDFIDNLTKGVKRIVVETLNDGKLLEKWSIAGRERLVVGVRDTVPDVFTSAAVTFWVGHTRFFGAKTIVARAFMGEEEVGVDTRVLSAKPKTTFSELQVYTPANFGNKAFNRLEFSAGTGSWFGLGSAAFNTARPVSP